MSGFQDVQFLDQEARCPCVLLLDTSFSMQGRPIEALNDGIRVFRDNLIQDPLASRRVEIAIVTFDSSIEVVQDFVSPEEFQAPTLSEKGATHMAEGINKALDMVHARKATYRANGIMYYRPWVFMITDGEPQGEEPSLVDQARQRIRDDEAKKRVAFFAVGVETADMQKLQSMVVRTALKLHGLQFTEMFQWLSASLSSVSRSKPDDDQVALQPVGWGSP